MDASYFNPLLKRALVLAQEGTTDSAPAAMRIPLSYYRAPDAEATEKEKIWEAVPLVLATTVQLRQPHDFLVRTVTGKSVLIARGADGIVRAFENYCRHRGASPASGCGNSKLFVCPYHAWSYDSSGRNKAIPAKSTLGLEEGMSFDLVELPCTERHGLIWVNLKPGTPQDIRAFLGAELDDEIGLWSYGQSILYPPMCQTVSSNWKPVVENFGETYHFATVHGQSIPSELSFNNCMTHDAIGRHHRMLFPSKSILTLAGQPEEQWHYWPHATIVYWIYPSTILVNVGVVAQVIDVLPGGPDSTAINTVSLGFDAQADAATKEQMDYIVQSARQAIFEEDGPVLNGLGPGTRHSSQGHVIAGRNEIGVQHIVKTIAAELGMRL
ncbi:MAG: aromatic ring-hydroxylating dioxygenase subunit alpha [Sphingomonadaceae bacterium]|nr:aromatic ring-hydroxylating dioxygenase subunit alpha [Sphingomonadaceae bacterium]